MRFILYPGFLFKRIVFLKKGILSRGIFVFINCKASRVESNEKRSPSTACAILISQSYNKQNIIISIRLPHVFGRRISWI